MGSNPTQGSEYFSEEGAVLHGQVELCFVYQESLGFGFIVGLEFSVFGGLITPAFSYILTLSSHACLSDPDALPCLVFV